MLTGEMNDYILIKKRTHTVVIYSKLTNRSYALLLEKDENGDEYFETGNQRFYIKDFKEKGQNEHDEGRNSDKEEPSR